MRKTPSKLKNLRLRESSSRDEPPIAVVPIATAPPEDEDVEAIEAEEFIESTFADMVDDDEAEDEAMGSNSESKLPRTKIMLSKVASAAATAMLIRTIAKDFLPDEFIYYISCKLRNFLNQFSSHITMVVEQYDGLVANEIYEAAVVYLGSKASSANRRFKIKKPHKEKSISFAVDRNEQLDDEFEGVKIKWVSVCKERDNSDFPNSDFPNRRSEIRSFEINFHKKDKQKVLESYLPYVLKQAQIAKNLTKSIKIFTLDPYKLRYGDMSNVWIPVHLDHPSNFDTLAMDSEMKKMIVNDLDQFVSGREYYKKVGKAWKRGYLLYGPPGTGKSSLIAAMANHLKFDVYDLELTALDNNTDLRKLLLFTANRSILVVEDIDCTIQFHDRAGEQPSDSPPSSGESKENENKYKVTLSGFLNFVDGLWSGCGDERIIIFTTNHKEKLDPALLRPGRMDMNIHMSYCTLSGFRLLVHNYLDVDDHNSFEEIEELIGSVEVTPAEVAEQLLKCKGNNVDVALSSVLSFLSDKKKETIMSQEKQLVVEEKSEEKVHDC
ncbi:AAA-ATPase At3g50940-like [Impatiens glandulifera]|uniref:AAA-ATPase At3g50940-like n=1 Tax=Impatiens glandulifera TaxID=253017 RepID=UPI001FB111C1|nr:AAA-ATPase At3g50940-like [Impatiens glandulifera]